MNKIEVYHQCGHNDVWNFDIFNKDNIGDGFIFAPKMAKYDKIEKLNLDIKSKSFFDPQFYYPRSTVKKFSKIDFFPNVITGGYSTTNYEELCYESANKCVEFQVSQDYKFIVVPTIVYDETPQNYIELLRSLYIEPFLQECTKQNIKGKKVLLSVVIKDTQLANEELKNELLNLITGYEEIQGVYLVPSSKSVSKRIKDMDYIFNLLTFIKDLKENDMYVHLAYIDIEGIIFSLSDIDSVSIGVFENVRKFNLEDFKEKTDGSHPNGPNRRIYSNKLFQWIDFDYIGAIEGLDIFAELFEDNKYVSFNVPNEKNWHFKNPELYKHYMMSMYNQYKALPFDYEKRYNFILNNLKEAIKLNELIENEGVLFDSNSNGEHLYKWVTAINKYNKYLKGE
ncbi:hypothetical protein [Clostridium sp. JS66]|uniref:hypothetical protein n=1 Tax=Clostridium sp. JS66 TaxID=3064705 RepID=UPI00298E0E9A|nr:hypothetical protein [Clostridium sp. JS66]WPC42835.1 hypothetical protein Q6H37_05020 [Clostridium sp. JS66]